MLVASRQRRIRSCYQTKMCVGYLSVRTNWQINCSCMHSYSSWGSPDTIVSTRWKGEFNCSQPQSRLSLVTSTINVHVYSSRRCTHGNKTNSRQEFLLLFVLPINLLWSSGKRVFPFYDRRTLFLVASAAEPKMFDRSRSVFRLGMGPSDKQLNNSTVGLAPSPMRWWKTPQFEWVFGGMVSSDLRYYTVVLNDFSFSVLTLVFKIYPVNIPLGPNGILTG